MIQIFILGSSSAYGVGGEDGGWADLIKRDLHKKMYSSGGIGQQLEIYNFGKSGAPMKFVLDTYPSQLKHYGRSVKTISIVSVGGNDIKAEGEPNNFVSTIEEYVEKMSQLLDLLKQLSTHVIVVGGTYYDESKTNPIFNPTIGGNSYFSNKRKQEFEFRLKQLCEKRKIPFVGVVVSETEWKQKYLYEDGLHPNHLGHTLISGNILKELEKLM